MGNMIGILSTVILVSTLATLIFAVGAYIMARRRRSPPVDAGDELAEDEIRADDAAAQVAAPAEPARADTASPPSGRSAPPDPPASTEAGTPNAGQDSPASRKTVFRRLTPRGEQPVASDENGSEREWIWE